MVDRYSSLACVGAFALFVGLSSPAAAQLASRPAEEWSKTLDQPNRLAGLRTDEVIARIELKAGHVVADLGAGTGVFSVPMAKAVAPGGKVYAVEVDKGYFDIINGKAKEAQVTNVQTVLGEFGDPRLPAADVDVAFFHDVLHHITDRAGYLKNVARYVKPSGRVVVIDLKPEQSPHKDQANLIVSDEQVTAWMMAAGFSKVEKVDLFPDKFFLVYSR
jgi:ubiquinone/menaquinone biosynthesis C-methylase UbiE